jgi:hypothetical protein
MQNSAHLGEIQKNSTERIRVSRRSYEGHEFIDIRIFFEDDTGEWKPTKKGITIAPDKVKKLVDILQSMGADGSR